MTKNNIIFLILGIIGIILFPPLWILFLTVTVIAMMFNTSGTNSTREKGNKEISKDKGYYMKRANAIRDAWQGRIPRTFYEVMGDLGNFTWLYYSEQLYNPEKITIKNEWIIEQFERTKKNLR